MKNIQKKILSNTFEQTCIGDVSHLYWLPNFRKMLLKHVINRDEHVNIKSQFFILSLYVYFPIQNSFKPVFSNINFNMNENNNNPFYDFTKEDTI